MKPRNQKISVIRHPRRRLSLIGFFCVGVSRLSLACAFVRPESEQNSSRLQTDVPLPCRLDLDFLYGRIYSAPIASFLVLISGLSCKTTFNKELRTSSFPLYSMKPNLRNLFMKKLTRDRVVPIISASVS